MSAVLFQVGCGRSGPEVVKVSGTVTRGGNPVSNIFLNFKPDEGRPSWGITDDDGNFTLEYSRDQKGARVGTHTVWVAYKPKTAEEEMDLMTRRSRLPPELSAILRVYGREESTPLRIEISEAVSDLEIKLD